MFTISKWACQAGLPDTPDNLYNFFIGRVRDKLHIILCFSPVGAQFGRRAQQFPGLINGCVAFTSTYAKTTHCRKSVLPCLFTQVDIASKLRAYLRQRYDQPSMHISCMLWPSRCLVPICRCTIDWFLPWPEDALTEVAGKFIDELPMACPLNVQSYAINQCVVQLAVLQHLKATTL